MLQVREKNPGHQPGKKIRLSKLRQQDLLQAKNKGKESESSLKFKMSGDIIGERQKAKEKNIQELQMLEQNLQNLFFQKQAFQFELRETQTALKELEKSGEEVFKMIGQLMIKTDKKSMKEELINKEKMIDLRIKEFGRQERDLAEKFEALQREALK